MFACITTLLVIVHLFSLMIATCVLPNIEAAIAIQKWTSSPHTEFRSQIEVAWILSTGIGLVLFLVGKFYNYKGLLLDHFAKKRF